MPNLPPGLPTAMLTAFGCLTVPGAMLLGAAAAGLGTRRTGTAAVPVARLGWVSTLAGILLLGLVAVDLAPDVVQESAELGAPLLLTLVPAIAACGVASALLWRPTATGCCSCASGLATALALTVHGLLEGFVVGLGVGVSLAAGLGLLALFAAHRFAEGFALGASLRPVSRRTRWVLLPLAAVTPLVGGDVGLLASPGQRVSVAVTAALVGLLTAAGFRLLAGPSVTEVVAAGIDGDARIDEAVTARR